MSAISLFIVFGLLLLLKIPVALTIAITTILPGLIDPSFAADVQYSIRAMISGVDSFPILAVPMFILSGIIMARGGISKKIFNFFSYFIGNKTAGLPIAVIVTCLFYGAISGSGPATTAAVGAMTIPILVDNGYDKVFSTSLVAVAGGLGVIIPPSIPFIFYSMSANTSVSDMFMAGIFPGLLIGFCLMAYAYYYCRKKGEDKEKLEENVKKLRSKGFWSIFKESFWALLSPIIILGSIYSGIASPTEAAVISVYYALIVSSFVYKTIVWKDIQSILLESVKSYTSILFIIASAMAFARVLTFMQIPQQVAGFIGSTFSGKIAVLLILNVLLLVVGMVMDTTPAILILTPILLPIATTVGMHPIHFGIVMVVNLAIGFVSPPLGVNLYVASSITDIGVMKIAKQALPFIAAFLIALMLITFIPAISLLFLG